MAKARTDTKALLRGAMAREGVPEPVIDHVMALDPVRLLYWAANVGFVIVMILGFGAGAVMFSRGEEIVKTAALARAAESGGLLYHTNFGFGFLILLFAWIFISGVLVSLTTMTWPRVAASVFAYTLRDPKNRLSLTSGGRLQKTPFNGDANEYLRAVTEQSNKNFLQIGFVLAALGIAIAERELTTYEIFTAEGYIATPLSPWSKEARGAWRDASSVLIGCNHVTGKNASDNVIYEVKLPDGRSLNLAGATPVSAGLLNKNSAIGTPFSGKFLESLEMIDSELEGGGAAFKRWRWLTRDPLHPDCLAVKRRQLTVGNYERLTRLLRVGKFPTDDPSIPTGSDP